MKKRCQSTPIEFIIQICCRLILRTLPEGSVIMTEDCHEDAALVYILSGSLVTSQSNDGDGSASSDRVLYTAVKVLNRI